MTTPTSTTPAVLIASGLDDLAQQNPIAHNEVTRHRTFDGDGFRIRHIAFDSGTVLPEHTAPVPIIVQVVQGAVSFEVGTTTYSLSTGAILHVGAEVPHQVTAAEPARLIITLLG